METTFERRKIFTDEFIFRLLFDAYLSAARTLNSISLEYSSLGIGVFNKEVLIDFTKTGVNTIIEKYRVNYDKEFNKVPECLKKEYDFNPGLIASKFSNHQVTLINIKDRLYSRSGHSIDYSLFEVKNGEVFLPKKAEEIIRDKASVFIERENEQRFVELAKSIENQLNELLEIWKKSGNEPDFLIESTENMAVGVYTFDQEGKIMFNPKSLWYINI